jgi:hypothetical protein
MKADSGSPPAPPLLRWLVAATLIYTGLTLLFTYPVWQHLDEQIFGARRDAPMFLWNTWWGPFALFENLENPLHTGHLFHPDGASLVIHTHSLLPALLSKPLQPVFGLVVSFNLMILVTFVLAGLATFLLVYDLGRSRRAALVAGALYAFCHTRSSMILFLNLIQTQFLVFYIWALWRAWQRRSKGWTILAATFAGCLLYSSYNLFSFAALFSGLFVVFLLAQDVLQQRPMRTLVPQAALLLFTIGLLGSPIFWQMHREVEQRGYYVTLEDNLSYQKSVPLSRLLIRGPLHGKDGGEGSRLPLQEASFLGYTTLTLAALGVVLCRRRGSYWFWLTVALLFLWCSLGARFNWDATSLDRQGGGDAWMPYQVLRDLPLLRELRNPHRYGLVGALALTVAAGLGLAALLRRSRISTRPVLAWGITLVALGGATLDFLQSPFPKQFRLPPVPDAIHEMAADLRPCSVLEFPSGREGYPSFSYYQTIHEKPVYLDGQLARIPDHLKRAKEDSPLMRALLKTFSGRTLGDYELQRELPAMRKEAKAANLGWVSLSWVDSDILWGKKSPAVDVLRELDELILKVFPEAELRYQAKPERVQKWDDWSVFRRRGIAAIWAIYRLPDRS